MFWSGGLLFGLTAVIITVNVHNVIVSNLYAGVNVIHVVEPEFVTSWQNNKHEARTSTKTNRIQFLAQLQHSNS